MENDPCGWDGTVPDGELIASNILVKVPDEANNCMGLTLSRFENGAILNEKCSHISQCMVLLL